MHYYKRNIGDYHKKAGRLSLLQHGVYTLLIDACYDREQFPTKEQAIDWVWASSQEEIDAVEFVLRRFFDLVDGVYVQNRIQEELDSYQEKSEKNRQIAIEREEKRRKRKQVVHETCSNKHETPPNHKPITNNHKPIEKNTYPIGITAELLDSISQYWNATMTCQPSVDLTKKTQINKKRWAKIKKILIDHPDYKDHEYWDGHIDRLKKLPELEWQRENKQLTFDQAIQIDKFERNLGFMRMGQ